VLWLPDLVFNEHGDIEEHVVQLRDRLLQVDEHLVAVLDVVDRLTELVLVALNLEIYILVFINVI
jgi:hypothetical protein